MSFVPNDIGAVSNYFQEEFFWSVTSGSVSQLPEFIGREQDAGVYDYFQAFDRIAFRLLKEIRNERLLKAIRVGDLESASGEDLVNLSKTIGLNLIENYIYDAFKQRTLTWARNPEGGTAKTIKRSLFFYIGADAFPVDYDPDTGDRIVIEDIISSASGTAVWGTTAGSTPGDEDWGAFNWGDENQITDENFQVTVFFNLSGSITDRSTFHYWSLDANRATLQSIIDEVKAAGLINVLDVVRGF